MSQHSVALIDKSVQTANVWFEQLEQHIDLPNHEAALSVLRGVLHRVRDQLTVDEVAHLGAQLPTLIRGIYYEAWKPSTNPEKVRDRDKFVDELRASLPEMLQGEGEPEKAFRAVFAVLSEHVTSGELDHVINMLPEPVQQL